MFSRFLSLIFIAAFSFAARAQSPASVAVPVTHHTVAPVTPPIKNIEAAPKEISKKKRKPTRVTVAKKPKPVVAASAK